MRARGLELTRGGVAPAHAERIGAIGVRWGYSAPGELEEAGAHVIVDEVAELLPVLRGPATWWV